VQRLLVLVTAFVLFAELYARSVDCQDFSSKNRGYRIGSKLGEIMEDLVFCNFILSVEDFWGEYSNRIPLVSEVQWDWERPT
jgi:hypothetical protein